MKDLPFITGNKVYLGPMPETNEFYKTYASWLNSERVRFGIGDHYYTAADARTLLDTWKNNPQNWTFCIYDAASDQPIGDVSVRYDVEEYDNNYPETAIMMGVSSRQGKGYEAMRLILDYAFNKLNQSKINLSVYSDNIPAVKLYEKLGFKKTKSRNTQTNGRHENVMILTKEEWNECK